MCVVREEASRRGEEERKRRKRERKNGDCDRKRGPEKEIKIANL
jgi:hypothetical protein